MPSVRVGWDPIKNRSNRKKHGIGFEEAQALFERDSDHLVIFDDQHSEDEERFFAIGPVSRRVVTVVYTEEADDAIRIISARKATPRERALFRRYMGGA